MEKSTASTATAVATKQAAEVSHWKVDPQHASAQFAVKHLMISTVRGEFHGVSGSLHLDESDVSNSSVDVTIQVASLDTREPDRDAHLKSPDFFDAAQFPVITFKSKKVEKIEDGELRVLGDLSIRGITKQVALKVEGPTSPVKDPWGNTRIAVNATAKINRHDFGVKWNASLDGGGFVVGDEVKINIDVEFLKQSA